MQIVDKNTEKSVKDINHNNSILDMSNTQVKTCVDFVICLSIAAKVFLIDYIGFGSIWETTICVLIVLRICLSKTKFSERILLIVLLMLLSICGGIACGGRISILIRNVASICPSLILVLYFYIISCEYSTKLITILRQLKYIINALLIINLIVAYIQVTKHTLIANPVNKQYDMLATTFWWDASSGLFEFFGTHSLCLYTMFVIVYNVWISFKVQSHLIRVFLYCYTAVISLISIYIAMMNDNKAMYILFAGIILLFIYDCFRVNISMHNTSTLLYAAILLSMCICLVYLSGFDAVRFLQKIIDSIRVIFRDGSDIIGSNERIAILGFALSLTTTWLFGVGLGNHSFFEENLFGFVHFGQSSLGSILVICGIWTCLLITLYFLELLSASISAISRPVRKSTKRHILLILVAVFAYSIPIHNFSHCFCLLIFIVIVALFEEDAYFCAISKSCLNKENK